ncbi:hypothetical protein [Euzebya tangerina]|uniref:hypothetical protein n=1 Tax=Euzebya tangerina TaxID=591198 RepID=UPI000E31FE0D|nr:hypothetical protein [Euzebya tangerina]
MAALHELLPSLTAHLQSLSDMPVDLSDTQSLRIVTAAIDGWLGTNLDDGLDHLEGVATDLLRDLSPLPQDPVVRAGVDLLRLVTSRTPLMMALSAGRFDVAWHWAVAPMIDGMPEEFAANVDVGRPLHVLAVHNTVAREPFWFWAGAVCHLAWSGGYMKDVAREVAVRLPDALLRLEAGPLLIPACDIATVLDQVRHPAVPAITAHLDGLSDDEGLDPEVRVALAIQLTGKVSRHLDRPVKVLANQALNQLHAHITPPQRLQLLVNGVAGDADEACGRAEELLTATRAASAHISNVSNGSEDAAHMRGRLFPILAPAARVLAEAGDAALVASLLRTRAGVEEEPLETPLLAFRIDAHQMLWCSVAGTATTPLPADLTTIMNTTLGLSEIDAGNGPALEALPDDRDVGRPVPEHAATLEAVTRAAVDRDLLVPLLAGADPRTELVHIGHDRLPICPVLQELTSAPVPLVVSHEVPLPGL